MLRERQIISPHKRSSCKVISAAFTLNSPPLNFSSPQGPGSPHRRSPGRIHSIPPHPHPVPPQPFWNRVRNYRAAHSIDTIFDELAQPQRQLSQKTPHNQNKTTKRKSVQSPSHFQDRRFVRFESMGAPGLAFEIAIPFPPRPDSHSPRQLSFRQKTGIPLTTRCCALAGIAALRGHRPTGSGIFKPSELFAVQLSLGFLILQSIWKEAPAAAGRRTGVRNPCIARANAR